MHVVVITPPTVSPLSLDLAKKHCRVEFDDDDLLIQSLIDTAVSWLDGPGGWLGRCLMPQTLELRLDSFYETDWSYSGSYLWDQGSWPDWTTWSNWRRWPFASRITLPYPPVVGITSIVYEGTDGTDQTLSSDGWRLDGEGDLTSSWDVPWPSGRVEADAVRIRYQAGYPLTTDNPPASTVPAAIRHALMLLVSHWYAHPDAVVGVEARDSSTEMPIAVEALLSPYRVWNV